MIKCKKHLKSLTNDKEVHSLIDHETFVGAWVICRTTLKSFGYVSATTFMVELNKTFNLTDIEQRIVHVYDYDQQVFFLFPTDYEYSNLLKATLNSISSYYIY